MLSFHTFIYLSVLWIAVMVEGGEDNLIGPESVKEKLNSIKLPPCHACKVLTNSFKQGIEKTAKSNFEGGDSAWEEEKLGSYAKSEVRFVEIEEGLCSDVERGKDQCHVLAEEAEPFLEEWWFKKQSSSPDVVQWLCTEKMKVCCPDKHFGPECTPCPGYPDNVCSNNGKCKGNGTRKGNGLCVCDEGYSGEICNQCATSYYASYHDENKILCSKCHVACQGPCSHAGSKGCIACNPGWVMDTERGCFDVNECILNKSPCKANEFCVNNEGSFTCLSCDAACNGCQGDGPDMCDKCADGFTLHDNICVDKRNISSTFEISRYLTYLGLCISTCIIFHKNPIIASIVGLCVALYVSLSIYMLRDMKYMNSIFLSE
uniref:EGF-like domain-containing protein n=1 Tax=Clastoptera arizonana TaxID=38151 RepID=A0A1B6EBB1_9HEMI